MYANEKDWLSCDGFTVGRWMANLKHYLYMIGIQGNCYNRIRGSIVVVLLNSLIVRSCVVLSKRSSESLVST